MSRLKRKALSRCPVCGRMLVLGEDSGLCLTCELDALRSENLTLKCTLEEEHRRRMEAEFRLRDLKAENGGNEKA